MAVPVLSSPGASGGEPGGPFRAGLAPAIADGFLLRTDTAPGLPPALIPGAVLVLAPGIPGSTELPRSPGQAAGQAGSAPGRGTDWACVTGKTQVAVAYAEELFRSGAAIIWADAGSRVNILAGYATAATSLGVDAGQGADTAARRLLAILAQPVQPWLVVLDGLRDPADLRGLIPSGPAGMALITTADARLIPDSWRAMILPVSPFSAREAMAYLRARLRSQWDQRGGMINLVTEVGGDPGALAHASGVIAVSSISCGQYTDRLILRRQQMAQVIGAIPAVAAATLDLAVESAEQLDAAAWPTLAVAATLDGQPIPSAVFDASAVTRFVTGGRHPDPAATARTLRVLGHLGLASVDSHAAGLIVRISQPVAAAVRAALTREDYDAALAAAAAGVTDAWPAGPPAAGLSCMLATCSVSLWRAAGDRLWADGNCPRLLQRAGDYLISAGMLGPALSFWADLAAAAERLLEPDHPDALMIAGRLAALHLADGDPGRAAERYEWIFQQLLRKLGVDHPAPVAAQLDLGRSLAAAGRFDQAVTVLDLAATGYRRVLGPDHLDTTAATEHLAAACVQAGERKRAIQLYQRALADRVRLEGPRHPDVLAARQRLARAYLAVGDVKAAMSEGKKVVADLQREFGENHLDTMAAIGDLGNALQAAGRSTQAVPLLEQAREGYEQILGADHRETLARCADLARAYNAIGWIVDADVLLRDTAERCDRFLPPGDTLTASVRELLASVSGR
jgi:tetratricopeptide (TPR) repeat protein